MAASAFVQTINTGLRRVPAWPLYALLPIPGLLTFWAALNNQLGPDPLRALEADLGIRGLQLLILTLLVTPIRRLTGLNLLKFRRAIGVVCFLYILGHLVVWVVLDQQLDPGAIVEEIIRRPYITIGMLGFLVLLPLAVTSNNLSIRKLGPIRWRKLHRLVYVAGVAGALHYVLIVKAWPIEPLVYAGLVLVLLFIRAWWSLRPSPRP
ncbi:MAG: protein-methionine-sulfoxide reductase heme-binding subunit MsrQ [Rhodobacteraceae bacterium]|nr:protein-methionine-sulfoxide reductase heme-binding subunit MsrQ [Paracoccaceae bacterium]